MDKKTLETICEIIKVLTPLILIILSACGFSHVNTQVNDINYDIDNIHEDVHDLQDLELQDMSDEELKNYKGHLNESEIRDLETRMQIYLNN